MSKIRMLTIQVCYIVAQRKIENLCNRLLHKFHGDIISFLWRRMRIWMNVDGMLKKQQKTVGRAMFLYIR